jgi:hypothetical protein
MIVFLDLSEGTTWNQEKKEGWAWIILNCNGFVHEDSIMKCIVNYWTIEKDNAIERINLIKALHICIYLKYQGEPSSNNQYTPNKMKHRR